MKYLIFLGIICLSACVPEQSEANPDLECTPAAFVGTWEYQFPQVVLDSVPDIPDIVITLSDDPAYGQIQIDTRYFYINLASCSAGNLRRALAEQYILVDENELHVHGRYFYFFGPVDIYKRK